MRAPTLTLALALAAVSSIGSTPAHAQWLQNGANIVYTLDAVGIGTTTPDPAVSLHVVVDGDDFPWVGGLRLSNANVAGTPHSVVLSLDNQQSDVDWLLSSVGNYPGQEGNFNIGKLGGGNHLVIAPDGNVAIGGNPRPAEKLAIEGAIRGNGIGGALRVKTDFGWTDIGPRNGGWMHLETDRPRFFLNKELRVDSGMIGSFNENLQLTTQGSVDVTILNSSGNVGIGTSAPSEKLEVAGNLKLGGNLVSDGDICIGSGC